MLWTCGLGRTAPLPSPVRTPAGAVLTVEAPADHPWHHALWFTIKFVNGENFWEEYGEFGLLDDPRVDEPPDGGVRATIDWVRPDGETVALTETRTHRADVDSTTTRTRSTGTEELVARHRHELDRTPFTTWGGYGGLTLRGAPDWHDTELILPDGSRHDRLLGERAEWCALEGVAPRRGRRATAMRVVLLDHPDNPSFPTPWYASNRADTYGDGWANFFNAAFLWDGPLARGRGRDAAPPPPGRRARRSASMPRRDAGRSPAGTAP